MKMILARLGNGMHTIANRVSVRMQLIVAFAAILLLTTALGAVSMVSLKHVADGASTLTGKWLPGISHLAAIRESVFEVRDFEIMHSRTDDKSYQGEYEEKIAEADMQFGAALGSYGGLVASDEEKALFDSLASRAAEYRRWFQRVIKLGRDGDQQDAAEISDGASSTSFDEVRSAIDALWAYGLEGSSAASQDAEATYTTASKATAVILTISLVAGVLLALGITRRILRALGGEPAHAARVARAVAGGDLTTPIVLRKGDTDSLMAQLQAMQTGLVAAVSAVRYGSERVAAASAQIAQGNQDLSDRTEHQAAELQKTGATMHELGSTVSDNAENARQANSLALNASQVAGRGGEEVGQVVHTMKGIQDASRKIGDIISVIDGIAFQTNILALNAAVEAARAGEQGRGFAVVASEVRSLAQRSAKAAHEIKNLIGDSVERVEQGTVLVDRAGNTMLEVVASIRRVSEIVGAISDASSEQSAGVAQVSAALAAMDRSTQQNAALVEESAAAATIQTQQAAELLDSVAVFRLAEAGR